MSFYLYYIILLLGIIFSSISFVSLSLSLFSSEQTFRGEIKVFLFRLFVI